MPIQIINPGTVVKTGEIDDATSRADGPMQLPAMEQYMIVLVHRS